MSLSGLPTTQTGKKWLKPLMAWVGKWLRVKLMMRPGQRAGHQWHWPSLCPECGSLFTACFCQDTASYSAPPSATSGTSSMTRTPSVPKWDILLLGKLKKKVWSQLPSRRAELSNWGALSPWCGISEKKNWRFRCGPLLPKTKPKDLGTQTDWWAQLLLICLLLQKHPGTKLRSAVRC